MPFLSFVGSRTSIVAGSFTGQKSPAHLAGLGTVAVGLYGAMVAFTSPRHMSRAG
jgi:hypothetical protein